jgi:hypothetical protein
MKPVFGLAAALVLALSSVTHATVYFQNDGACEPWPNYPQVPQAQGTVSDITSPTYLGPTAIKFTQTWIPNYTGRYHSEVTYFNSQQTGDDRYYGLSVFLPSNWVYASDNISIQQWAGDGPWIIMEVRGSNLVVLPHVTGITTIAPMPIGQWVRIVARLRATSSGLFEVWVNGTKRISISGDYTPNSTSGQVRWSAGEYVTGWTGLTTQPSPSYRELYQDHYRITSTEAEAEPTAWNETYQVQNVASGLSMLVSGAATSNGATVVQGTYGGTSTQWRFTPTSNSYFQVVNVNSGLDAVVQSAATTDGAKIIQWSFGSAGNDQWKPVRNSDNTYTFFNLKSGKVLEDPGSSTASGTQLDQRANSGGSNQHWRLILH